MYGLGGSSRYLIRYGVESWLDGACDDLSPVTQVEGLVVCSDGDGIAHVCGRVRAYVLKAEEMLSVSRFDIAAWSEQEELDDIARTVYSPDGDWSLAVKACWSPPRSRDVFVIEEIYLEDAHRGMGVGLAVANRTIDIFGMGCGFVVISPWPTEVKNRDDEAEAFAAHAKIGKHSEKIGFRMLPGTDLWMRSVQDSSADDTN